jgi:hypothetical protein
LNRRLALGRAVGQVLEQVGKVGALAVILTSGNQSLAQPAVSGAIMAVSAPPSELSNLPAVQSWDKRGYGELRVFLFKVYDAVLWVPSGLTKDANPLNHPLALEMVYSITVKSEDIVESSRDEILRLAKPSAGIENKISEWARQMRQAFPAVARGDRLTGIHWPGKGASFFHNGRPTFSINDVEFTQAFFGIWLDERTKRPELRNSLLKNPSAS